MANTKTVIELNGKRYDAGTGTLLDDVVPAKPAAHHPAKPGGGHNVDGFFKATATLPVPTDKAVKRAMTARKVKQPIHPHKPQRTNTLMRHVVKKPAAQPVKAKAKEQPAVPAPTPAAITLHDELIRRREVHAQHVAKSPLISRFGTDMQPSITKKTAHVPVRPAPTQPAHAHAPAPKPHHASHAKHPVPHAHVGHAHHAAFSKALEHASSHTQPKPAKPPRHHKMARKLGVSPRALNITAASFAAVLLVGFVAYQNAPNLSMRVASSRAGFQASLPAYRPSGFALSGGVKAQPGVVTFRFRSTSDSRNFQVSQRPSNWTSQTLLNNHVATKHPAFQAYEDKGKTIYIYNDSNATWVNGGVWYTIEGASALNTEQLLRLANSM